MAQIMEGMPAYFWLTSSRLKEPIQDDVPYTTQALRQDLRRVRNAWEECQASRDRNAIYGYLSAVFDLVMWWAAQDRAVSRARWALRLSRLDLPNDEPFAAIDAMTREAMQSELERFVAKTGQTVVFITHSIDEAVILGDRVVVISYRPGQIKEIVDVALPRPRFEYDVKTLPKYSELRDHIWRLVKDAALQTARGAE